MVVVATDVGMDPRGLDRVEELFNSQIEEGYHPGAALAVYRFGRPVLDLQGGLADVEAETPVDEHTMFVLYSSTKPLTASCLHLLWERGEFDWDDPVSAYWPRFARNGKDEVTIRQVMTHQGGFPETPSHMTWEKWSDWDAVVRAMEEIRLDYAPGRVIAYHPRNFGWVLGELVRRIDGRPFDQFLREEVTGPLGIDHNVHVGLPPSMLDQVSRLYAMEDCDRPGQVTIYNRPEVHLSVQPAGGGIATASGLARFYAMLAGGGALDDVATLKPDTVAEATKPQVEGLDHTSGPPSATVPWDVVGRPSDRRSGQGRHQDLRSRWLRNVGGLGQPGHRAGGGLHNQRLSGRSHQHSSSVGSLPSNYRRLRLTGRQSP